MENNVLKVSIRQGAIYIPETKISGKAILSGTTTTMVINAKRLGFTFSEELLQAMDQLYVRDKHTIIEVLKEISGVRKNWTPLVKEWNIPTGESWLDQVTTYFNNILKSPHGASLKCGHFVPNNTFPLERYNGCPFCGTPFEKDEIEHIGQGTKLKVLELWGESELNTFYNDLLSSKTALDATQVDSLKILIANFSIPKNADISIKETVMLVIDALVESNQDNKVQDLFKNPMDILRYLWYKHTGFLQIIEPKTIIQRKGKNSVRMLPSSGKSGLTRLNAKSELKLKYSRTEAKRVAKWINDLSLPVEKSCEIMHPKRGIWVRLIRALRLAEYSKKKGFEKLAELLDVFYNEQYQVWQGKVNSFRLKSNAEETLSLLKERPGLFARSLFSNMLWFGDEITLSHFKEVVDQIPARLLFTLNSYSEIYFSKTSNRTVKPLGGTSKRIPTHQFLQYYADEELKVMRERIAELCLTTMRKRFANQKTDSKTMYIEESLFKIPIAIGDRSDTIQDLPAALLGTRFPLEGRKVRLFMQWGNGLPAQHLDMDLSCMVAYENKTDFCSYSQLIIPGCKHSGDIQHIPNKVGTAEYIELDIDELAYQGARYVSFTCNAYTMGSLSPNMVVGWMDSKYSMKISRSSGVAYDPSCVQQQVRITKGINKGLVFGVLDVGKREVVWLEMSFGGQVVRNLSFKTVEGLLEKLDSKLNVGHLLQLKAEAQGLTIVTTSEVADEVYDLKWSLNSAGVTQLLVD